MSSEKTVTFRSGSAHISLIILRVAMVSAILCLVVGELRGRQDR